MKTLNKQQIKVILQNAPQGSDPTKIVEALASKGYKLEGYNDQPVPKPEPNYLERVAQNYQNLGDRVISSIGQGAEDYTKKSQSGDVLGATGALLKTGLRTAGAVAEGAFTPIVEAPIVKQALDFVGQKIGDTEIGKKLSDIIQKNPEKAQDVMDIVNILTLGGGAAVEKPVLEGIATGLKTTGKTLEKGGLKAIETQKSSFIRGLVRPEQTKLVRESQVARTTEKGAGVFKRSEVAPTTQELKMEQAVSTIPEVSSKNTFQQNFNFIKDANQKEALNLENALKQNDFVFPKKELKSKLNEVKQNLADNPSLVGDNEKIAQKLLTKFNSMLDATQAKGSSLLQLRKDFDSWVQSQKGTKIYDPNTENAFSIVNRELRQGINNFIDTKATNIDIKESLSKQSALYRAMKNIEPKAAIEADTAVGRVFQNMANAVGIKNKIVQQVAAIVGIGGLGAAATFAPAAAVGGGLAFLAYKGGQLVLKPGLRIALGKLLETAGNALSKEDTILIKSLLQDKPKLSAKSPK